jgi:glucose-1-phosphate thymidylyltransferase
MAGMGTRMRPHTLNTPKPMLRLAGKSIVEQIVYELVENTGKKIEEIHFVIRKFGKDVEKSLLDFAANVSAKGYIHYQEEALGTAHAVYCAKDALKGEVLISFADTLVIGDLKIDKEDAIIWTKEVNNPENYGIAVINKRKEITDFVEKPSRFLSNNAIIGIYYFKKSELLEQDIKNLIENDKKKSGEFQLTDSLVNLMKNGMNFKCKTVDYWLDCGSKSEFLNSNRVLLGHYNFSNNCIWGNDVQIVEPVFLGNNVKITNSRIGPYVSLDNGSIVENSSIENSIIGSNVSIRDSLLINSMIGNYSKIIKHRGSLNIGDYNECETL